MKTKIVLWGEAPVDEKVLIAMELIEADNLVRIHTIPASDVTETFYNQMMNQWRNGQAVPLPESTQVLDRPLTMTDSLLPHELKTDRQDILARAKTEWHFVVLSSKLYNTYAQELSEFKERVDQLSTYDNIIWDEMKEFWGKVQAQVREQNLFREHATELRSRTNQLFDNLKSLRKAMNDEYERVSREHMATFFEKLDNIEGRIKSGLGLHPIFNELKDMQRNFKNTKFTRKHHNDVWKRIDGAFKLAKEKKYGSKAGGSSGALGRLESRYNGLLSAIDRMSKSIERDKKDEQFQEKRINTTDGQLELQIRQAKMAMIQERVASKQVKLDDMLKTKVQLEEKMELEKKKEAARQAKREEKEKLAKAKQEAKEGIAAEIESNSEARKEREEKLRRAAEKIKKRKEGKKASAVEEVAEATEITPSKVEIAEVEETEVPVDIDTSSQANAEEIVSPATSEATKPEPTNEAEDAPVENQKIDPAITPPESDSQEAPQEEVTEHAIEIVNPSYQEVEPASVPVDQVVQSESSLVESTIEDQRLTTEEE